jgi:hypothetical protein
MTVSAVDDVPDEIEGRLERWGHLARGRYEDLGITDRSVLARIIEEGAGACQISDWASQHLPDDVVEVDQAIARLPNRYRRAIKLHYMTELDTQTKAKEMDTSRTNFFLLVNAGKVGVYMRLVAHV